eukprot:1385844-Rhodomonas_salina.1
MLLLLLCSYVSSCPMVGVLSSSRYLVTSCFYLPYPALVPAGQLHHCHMVPTQPLLPNPKAIGSEECEGMKATVASGDAKSLRVVV